MGRYGRKHVFPQDFRRAQEGQYRGCKRRNWPMVLSAGRCTGLVLLVSACHGLTCPWAESWEWAAVYHVHEGGHLLWSAEKKEGAYADASMKLGIRTAHHADAAGLEEQEQAAAAGWGTPIQATTSTVLRPNNVYLLNFDADSWVSLFKIEAQAESNLAFFAEHSPTEFTGGMISSFLLDEQGEALAAKVEESAASCAATEVVESGGIGEVVIASLLVCLPTLMGIALVVCTCKTMAGWPVESIMHFVNAAASGVLFGAAFFLLLPEAHHMLGAAVDSESAAAATWGSMVILGWLLGALTHHAGGVAVLKCGNGNHAEAVEVKIVEAQVEAQEAGEAVSKKDREQSELMETKWAIAGPVFLGDFFHNLADGFMIGSAFRSCGSSFGWKLVGASLAHEFPQEMADFFVLIRQAGLKWHVATLLNFLSGLPAVVGAVIAYYVDTSDAGGGGIMAAGGGVFLYVAATELGPMVSHIRRASSAPLLTSLGTLLVFVLGVATIGLVLLDHEHCYAPFPGTAAVVDSNNAVESGNDPHAGHSH